MPKRLRGRSADNWRVLFAIADAYGEGWGESARLAALIMAGGYRDEDIVVTLLGHIRELPRRSFTKRAIVSVERHRRQFTLAESHVGERLLLGARSSQGQSVGRLINPNDLPGRANQFGGQECNVAGSASDVENTHARGNPCFDQKLPRNRVDELPLT